MYSTACLYTIIWFFFVLFLTGFRSLWQVSKVHKHQCSSLAVSEDSLFLLTAGHNAVKVWDYNMQLDINSQVEYLLKLVFLTGVTTWIFSLYFTTCVHPRETPIFTIYSLICFRFTLQFNSLSLYLSFSFLGRAEESISWSDTLNCVVNTLRSFISVRSTLTNTLYPPGSLVIHPQSSSKNPDWTLGLTGLTDCSKLNWI